MLNGWSDKRKGYSLFEVLPNQYISNNVISWHMMHYWNGMYSKQEVSFDDRASLITNCYHVSATAQVIYALLNITLFSLLQNCQYVNN